MSIVPKEIIDEFMQSPEERLDRMLADFEAEHDTASRTPGANLRALLEQSPELRERVLASVESGHLKAFEALPAGANAGGEYDREKRAMLLPMHSLAQTDTSEAMAGELVFVLGHELEHSFFRKSSEKAMETFRQDVLDISLSEGPHDYTDTVRALLSNYRENEARAHIGGFNALASRVMADDPGAGLKELYNANPGRMEDFIERSGKSPHFSYALKPGLTLEADNTLSATPANIEAMGRYYFDKPASVVGLGTHGNQDYANYYGEFAIAVIERAENVAHAYGNVFDTSAPRPEVRLDMAALGLKASLVEVDVGFIDTGRNDAAIANPAASPIALQTSESPAAPEFAENAMYAQAKRSIDGLIGQLGICNGTEAANLAAATALQAMQSGMHRVDGVVVGVSGRIYVYEGDPANASVNRAAVDVDRAKLTPARDSLEAMAAALPPAAQQPPVHQQGLRM